ncbi:MAG: menaquinone biosynthetic enzyme MqnA/MqnD family protein [Bacteroidota bacterium]|jgi:chorismate dehydratase|nr:menaquinone biosynthesis protein [Bacteroidota bacterium]MCA6441805.1 menaquinone biosynthesis protein [Bacteroidota bacterium]
MKLSIVNYTNTLPFRWAIHSSELIKKIDLEEDIPSICAQKLKHHQVDVALVPVALLCELSSYHIITDFCIGALEKVDSVKLYAQKPINELSNILLDYQSKSSVTLIKILCKEFWKINPNFIPASVGFEEQISYSTGAVIIGDRTFGLSNKYKFEYDLATAWFELTQLPFVFAVWVANVKPSDAFIDEFNSVLKYGISNIELAVDNSKVNYDTAFVKDYLTKSISYNLDAEKKKGLNLFLNKIKELNLA